MYQSGTVYLKTQGKDEKKHAIVCAPLQDKSEKAHHRSYTIPLNFFITPADKTCCKIMFLQIRSRSIKANR